ncbi:anti-phage BREX system Lon protease BrxL, partial [Thiolapillus sp.]|uniref:anti-phage BREX system Lon protease BrxL n=1 Tax=Thiolapillus sp. TaxID=2017437 RepID=UPI003AF50968
MSIDPCNDSIVCRNCVIHDRSVARNIFNGLGIHIYVRGRVVTINEHFQGLVVRKDLVKAVKGNAIVPAYVLEYLLGQYCAT